MTDFKYKYGSKKETEYQESLERERRINERIYEANHSGTHPEIIKLLEAKRRKVQD